MDLPLERIAVDILLDCEIETDRPEFAELAPADRERYLIEQAESLAPLLGETIANFVGHQLEPVTLWRARHAPEQR